MNRGAGNKSTALENMSVYQCKHCITVHIRYLRHAASAGLATGARALRFNE